MKSLFLLSVFAVLPAGLFLRSPAPAPAPATAAEATAYSVDSVHSCVNFRIKHMGVSWFYGRFNKVTGSLSYDEAKPETSTISIDIAADSVDTNNTDRDKHVTGPSMFSAAEFPSITFKSTKVAKKDKKLSVTGDFSFHGKTKSITVDVDPVGAADTKMGKRAGFETMFEFKRSDYGLGQDLDALGDDIRVMVSVEGVVADKKK